MKIYPYRQACNLAYKTGKKLSEMFIDINVPSKQKGWVKKERV